MFSKYEFQRKKSPFNKNCNEVRRKAAFEADCKESRKLNGALNDEENDSRSSEHAILSDPIVKVIVDSDSEEDDSYLLKSAFDDNSKDCFQSKSKRSNKDCKGNRPIVTKVKPKRKRVIPFDDSDSDPCLTPTKKQRNSPEKMDRKNDTNLSQDTNPVDDDFKQLKQTFSSKSNEEIRAALRLTDCLGQARIVLSNPFWSGVDRYVKPSETSKQIVDSIEIISDDEGDVCDGNLGNSVPDGEFSGYTYDKNNIDSEDSNTNHDDDMSSKQMRILSFFDDCSPEELELIPGLSKMKANKLISLRPFVSWQDLEAKLKSTKSLSEEFLEKAYNVLRKRDDIQSLMKRCKNISKDVQLLLSTRLDKQVYQPETLNPSCQLKPYQLTGLNWLKLMHNKGMNCILADEMGLGKTIQALSLIAHLIEEGDNGPFLVVAPASTIDNWARELDHFYPKVTYTKYYGSIEERSYLRHDIRSGDYQVIIATYQTAISTFQDRSFFQKKLKLHYVVFDEGHMLKNMRSQRYQKLFNINAKRRLLLTGTPLQNDLIELISLLCFVMPDMFGTCEVLEGLSLLFSYRQGNSSVRRYHEERLQEASSILKPFVLRRLKTDVLNQLPAKTEEIVMVDLTARQRALYDKVFANCQKEYKKKQSGAALYGKYKALTMPLRMTCNHPLLLRHNFDDLMLNEMAVKYCRDLAHKDSEVDLVYEDMTVLSDFELHQMCRVENNLKPYVLEQDVILDSGKFEYLKKTLPEMKEKGDRVLLFSQFTLAMDIIEVFLKHYRYRFLRLDGSTKVNERQDLIDQFNKDKDIFVFILSTKAGGLGINLTSANVVILHDIDFNPYNDKQAEDRCHRVGQTREVRIYKLISKGTIEEAILNCAKSKLKLEKDVMSTQETDSCGFEESETDVITFLGQTFKE